MLAQAMPTRNIAANSGGQYFEITKAMIDGYDDGRSRSFFCRAAALLDVKALKGSLDKAKNALGVGDGGTSDTTDKAKVLRGILTEAACCAGIELKAKK